MQNDFSHPASLSDPAQDNCEADPGIDDGQERRDDEPSTMEPELRSIMSQHTMETLTSWFPKSARALACVLRSGAQHTSDASMTPAEKA